MLPLLHLTLFFFSTSSSWNLFITPVHAAQGNESCSIGDQRLQQGTYQFSSDCDAMWFCNSSSICDWKKCKRDDFPFGYWDNVTVPDKCDSGFFCPDEQDDCQALLSVGSSCQLNRDDECEAPPNFKELADNSGLGLNVNGSVCLNNVCMWANATLGNQCVIENTPYVVYTSSGEYADVVSRDNCKLGLYCDGSQKVCMNMKDLNAVCDADKECKSYNCLASGVCGKPADTPNHVAVWVYIICGVGIFGGMIGTLVGMFFLHKGQRDEEREKRLQYWREQNAFRQNILQMQETARNSLMSLPMGNNSQRESMYSRDGINSEDSQLPILHSANKSSGLRHYVSDDGLGDSEDSVYFRGDQKDFNRF